MAVTPETITVTREVPGTDEERTDSVSVHDIHTLPTHVRKRAEYNLGQRIALILTTVGLVAWLAFLVGTGGVTGYPAGGLVLKGLWHVSNLVAFSLVFWFLKLADYCERER